MKGYPVDQLVYECMFARPKQGDPPNFQAFLQRNLIPEVRQETHAFYGHLDTQEAKYPGLDYTHPTHRIRLSRWPWHRRLFRAFDALGLTHAEIAGLTKWEGTKWAKEKFEKEQGVVIKDTTDDGILDWVEPAHGHPGRVSTLSAARDAEPEDKIMGDDESEEELESVGVELNQRLRAQAARREAGDTGVVLDEEWEQWLKNAIETGELATVTEELTEHLFQHVFESGRRGPNGLLPASMINAAQNGQWSEIPESLHAMLRNLIDSGSQTQDDVSTTESSADTPSASENRASHRGMLEPPPLPSSWRRRTYSDLRLPVGESSASPRTAGPPGA